MLTFVLADKVCVILLIRIVSIAGKSLRVVGGRDAREQDLPYAVRLEVVYTLTAAGAAARAHVHVCTAAALAADWALTAAHCVDGLQEIHASLRDQPTSNDPKSVLRYNAPHGYPTTADSLSEIISTHNYHNYRRVDTGIAEVVINDVALLKTTTMTLEVYGKLSAVDFSTLSGQGAVAVGYGLTNISGIVMSTLAIGKPLQTVDVLMKNCDGGINIGLHPALCLSRRCGAPASLCPGDSGGPLVHASGIVGVNSKGFMIDCDPTFMKMGLSSNVVGYITPISPFIEWIADLIRKERTYGRPH